MSICLYEYLCRNIVGSEDYIELIRLVNATTDRIAMKPFTQITSGSFGEGLELQGSDYDIMFVIHVLEVTRQTEAHRYNSGQIFLLLDNNDVQSGFSFLRLMKGNPNKNLSINQNDEKLYMSSLSFKQYFLNEYFSVLHGPCISDKYGFFDIACCLHAKSWITSASEWATRSNNSWPTNESTHHDAVTGWLMLASLFYKKKQYDKALYILSYSLRKCTIEKLHCGAILFDLHQELLQFQPIRRLGIIRLLRILYLPIVKFSERSSLIPDELKIDGADSKFLPPVLYLHFLTFLCHYHLHNIRNYQESLGDLRLIIEEDFMSFDMSYYCLGVAFLVVGDRESAREVLIRSIKLLPIQNVNPSFELLKMMDLV
ncbi:unnamed protein product [Mytilus coruscus]|uniref:Uncharacterized protein n=1 Tax=Mytilus coruscus TaxID=42192 RepID=A0A6J8CZN5_MYTCO|nr:unnamed protein product [Mytilus coruscus]